MTVDSKSRPVILMASPSWRWCMGGPESGSLPKMIGSWERHCVIYRLRH